MSNMFWDELCEAVLGHKAAQYTSTGHGELPSFYAVTDFAEASIGLAGVALAQATGQPAGVVVDRRKAALWFDMTVAPIDWELPPIWDAIAGVYRTKDGFIRLHTNAPHHRDAAMSVIGGPVDKTAVAERVLRWEGAELEQAVVSAKGCAAFLRSAADWARHPQGAAVAAEPLVHWEQTGECTARTTPSLQGLKVLDLTRVLAGPVCTRFLAGFGADVLRIDPLFWNEPAAEQEVTLGKRCAGLDLKTEAGREALRGLMADADVMVHGYRADALEALGFGADARRTINPTLIDVSLNAYGWTGPWRNRRGFDSLVQMSCGIAAHGMAQTDGQGPVPLPVQALDHGAGYLMAASVLRALKERGEGRVMSARLSLARTAECLKGHHSAFSETDKIVRSSDDLAPGIEQTTWGPAHRVAPPVSVNGVSPTWAIPAGALRRHSAQW